MTDAIKDTPVYPRETVFLYGGGAIIATSMIEQIIGQPPDTRTRT